MNSETRSGLRALVVVESNIERDPRVRRQIDWLTDAGWSVDSLGFGDKPTPKIHDHFAIRPYPKWTGVGRLKLAAANLFLPYKARFRVLRQNYFPPEVSRRVRAGRYDLIILNDIQLLPWLSDTKTFPKKTRVAHIHVDLHEWFSAKIPNRTLQRRLTLEGYHAWGRNHIAHPAIDTRSLAVNNADAYLKDFDIPRPVVVRNIPPFVDQKPTPVSETNIRLLHHGAAAWTRGYRELIDAMRLVDVRFTLTLMLVGPDQTIREIMDYAGDLGDRVTLRPPAPMAELAHAINEFDVEVMFFPPVTENLVFALPNKLFEAIQGRLAVVIGPSASMVEIVEPTGIGVVTQGWSAEDLAQAINALSTDDVRRMKQASHALAPELSAEGERSRFFESIGFPEN